MRLLEVTHILTMKPHCLPLLLTFLGITTSATITFNAWQSLYNDNVLLSEFPEEKILSMKPNTAIGFTGGGSRAYIAALGQLAALTELDLIKYVRYIGGTSGGTWATTTYVYNQNGIDDVEFLGPIVNPEDLTLNNSKDMSENCARSYTNVPLTLIALEALLNGTVSSLPDAWVYGVYKTYHEKANILPNVYFSWDQDTVDDIKSRNPQLNDATFLLPTNSDRPYPILGTSLVGPMDGGPYNQDNQNLTLLEITPLYVGQMHKQTVTYSYHLGLPHRKSVGGLIEPFAVSRTGTDSPNNGLSTTSSFGTLTMNQPSDILDLQNAAGLSSYAPGVLFESLPKNISQKLGMIMDYWSPTDIKPSGFETYMGDGGSYENINLISFLQRKVEKIILFINSVTPLLPFERWDVEKDIDYDGQIADCVSGFFGIVNENVSIPVNRTGEYYRDQVFDRNDYITVVQGLQKAQKDGLGIVRTFNLTTVANSWWGIPAGFTSQITFVYLGRLRGWEELLSDEMKPLLIPEGDDANDLSIDVSGTSPFREFPHYVTSGGIINYERANVLADLTGWAVLQHEELFRDILS